MVWNLLLVHNKQVADNIQTMATTMDAATATGLVKKRKLVFRFSKYRTLWVMFQLAACTTG